MAAWRHAGLDIPCVAVNLSPLNFQNAKLAAVVAETIAPTAFRPQTLMLEITEGVLLNERSAAIETMNAIRKLGVGLSLDDFGTGYSSLSRLAHLPIRGVKIDRSFMRNIERDASARAIATAGRPRRPEPENGRGRRRASRPRDSAICWPSSAATVVQGLSLRACDVARSVRAMAARPCRRAGADAAAKRRRGPFATDAVAADCVRLAARLAALGLPQSRVGKGALAPCPPLSVRSMVGTPNALPTLLTRPRPFTSPGRTFRPSPSG